MPFGLIFGALFFGLVCTWFGLQLSSGTGGPTRLAGLLFVCLGLALGWGLLLRRRWARWAGVLIAAAMSVFAAWLARERGDVVPLLLLFASLATAVLLTLPPTARDDRSAERRGGLGRWLGLATMASSVGLAAVALWAVQQSPDLTPRPAQQASAMLRVGWADFGTGIERARVEGKPMLVNFNAAWCGYCKKMDRSTWKHPEVVDRLAEIVAVRVDIDEMRPRNGYAGSDLAKRYQVHGTPTMMLVNAAGDVVAQTGGYNSPAQLLTWLDDALGRLGRGSGATSVQVLNP